MKIIIKKKLNNENEKSLNGTKKIKKEKLKWKINFKCPKSFSFDFLSIFFLL